MDGKALSKKIHGEIQSQVEAFIQRTGVQPGLATLRVGNDAASQVYVNRKAKICTQVGMKSIKMELSEDLSQEALLNEIRKLNTDDSIHGILVQLPLPKQISTDKVLETISPEKDVDGFHVVSAGKLFTGQKSFVACTPKGIMRILDEYEVPMEGAEAVVVGRSNIVGKPIAQLLMARHATVTICHSRTRNLPEVCRRADILVAAIGRAEFVKGSWVKEGAAVIDVGINRTEEGKLVGDVEYDAASQRAGWITPVPGGVGPLTIAMLLSNTVEAAQRLVEGEGKS